MSPLGFYALSAAWLFFLLAPLILFYFLKLKRPRLEIPSLVLWRRVLEDRRVNSPFQRFKRNILLFIQIALLTVLVLAAMQPFFRRRPSRTHRLPVLIDCSASMGALDAEGKKSRLDEARKKAGKLIQDLLPDQQLCIISFADTARKRTGFTNNKRILAEALAAIEVEDVASNTEDALRMAQALARSFSFDEVLLLSDGNFPAQANFELSFNLNYQRTAPAGPNLGITSLNARRSSDDSWDLFVQVEGSPAAAGSARLEISRDGDVIGSEDIVITNDSSEKVVVRVRAPKAAGLKATLIPDGFDSLAADNAAYLDLPAARPLWVYVPESLPAYRHALSSIRGVRVFTGEDPGDSSYDLVITDRESDLALEATTCLTVGIVPPDLAKSIRIERTASEVVDWERNSSLLRHVEMRDVLLLDNPASSAGTQEANYENMGYEILAHGHRGPLVLQRRQGGRSSFHMMFHTDRSTLPYRVGFPILVSNLVEIAMRQAGVAEIPATRTGVLPPLTLVPDSVYTIDGPDGASVERTTDAAGRLSGVSCARVGVYTVSTGGAVKARLGAGLLSARETALAGQEEIQFNEDLSVAASSETLKTERPLWSTLAFIAFFILLGEWWYFQRKSGG